MVFFYTFFIIIEENKKRKKNCFNKLIYHQQTSPYLFYVEFVLHIYYFKRILPMFLRTLLCVTRKNCVIT